MGIYRTLDGGENWTLVKQTYYGKPGNYTRFGADMIAFAGNTIYAGTLNYETPHIASATEKARDEMAVLAATNIIAFFEGKVPPNVVG